MNLARPRSRRPLVLSAALAVTAATLVAAGGPSQAVSEPESPLGAARAGAVDAPLAAAQPRVKVAAFKAKAPSSVRTREVFPVTGELSRRYGGLAVVGEVQVGKTWVPIKDARVSRDGRVRVQMQLSNPGTHRLRLRVPGKQPAQSQVLTVRSTGKVTTDESPLRMYSHWLAGRPPATLRATGVQPRADGATAATEVAAATSGQLAGFQSLAEGALDAGGAAVVGFGVNALLGLLFPGTSAATGAQIAALQQEMQQDFAIVYQDLAAIQSTLVTVEEQNSQIFDKVSQVSCQQQINQAQTIAESINATFKNYENVLTPTWGQANINYGGGAANARVIGNYVFGAGSGTPSFASGVNSLQTQVTQLANLLSSSNSQGLIFTCASAAASNVIQGTSAPSTTNPPVVPIGTLDTSYAEQMQQLTGYFTSILNVGAGLVGIGDVLAAATLVSPSVQTPSDFLQACNSLSANAFSCVQTAAWLDSMSTAVGAAWQMAGASWSQVTNGTLAADVYATNNMTSSFTNGSNAWVTDIASYRNGYFGQGATATTPLSSTSVNTSNPASGLSSLSSSTWAPLTFSPATSDDWNSILMTESATSSYPGAPTGSFLAQCGYGPSNVSNAPSDPMYNCQSPRQVGTLMAAAGLNNGGAPVSPSNPLVLYTGEDYAWSALQSPISSGVQETVPGDSLTWVSQSGFSGMTLASFLDTGMWPSMGVSAVVNDPGAYDFSSGQGAIGSPTINDVFPFATKMTEPNQCTGSEATCAYGVTMQDWSAGYNFVAVPCASQPASSYQSFGGSFTLMNWISGQGTNGQSTSYGSGCGWTSYYPRGGAPNTAQTYNLTSSQLPTFYAEPVANFTVGTTDSLTISGVCSNATPSTVGCPPIPYPSGWSSLPGFVTEVGSTTVTPPGQQQYLWPVVPLDNPTGPGQPCPTYPGQPTWTSFTQGSPAINIPQTCQQLYNEWLSVTAGQTIGPVSVFVQPETGLATGNAAQVQFNNSSSSPVTLDAVFAVTGQASGTAFPTGPASGVVTGCQSGKVDGQTVALCQLTLPAGATTVQVPVSFASASATGTIYVGVENAAAGAFAGTTTPITPAAIPGLVPAGVTNLAATFNLPTTGSTGTGGVVTLSWTVPSSPTPITSYQVTGVGPSSSSLNVSVPPGSTPVAAGGTMSANVTIPVGGYWTFTVSAVDAAGAGPADVLSITIGNAPPPPPRNFRGLELADGQVALRWQPTVVAPPVNYYTIAWWYGDDTTPPAGIPSIAPGQGGVITAGAGTSLVGIGTTQESVFFVPSLPATGSWTFQIVATNAIGTSTPPVTTMVNMQGFRPSQVLALSPDIGATGRVGASWIPGAVGVPAPTSYTVGLYAPTQCTGDDSCTSAALTSITLNAPSTRGPIRVADFFQLGRNSAVGAYTITVTATNVYGNSATARGTVYLTSDFISQLTMSQQAAKDAKEVPPTLAKLDAQECAAGQISGQTPWGTCTNGVWTPKKGTG